MGIEESLLEFVREAVIDTDEAPLTAEEPLLDGRLDSLSILRLVVFIEEQFQIQVADDELVPEHFANVNSIAAFIRAKSRSAG